LPVRVARFFCSIPCWLILLTQMKNIQMGRIMRTLLISVLLLSIASPALSQYYRYGNDVRVRGHLRRDGTYVQPYHRTVPDGNPWNNYSTQGNINPWTGQQGHVNPYQQNPYQQTNPFYTPQRQRRTYSWP
jgi:hypothetical protein